MNTSESAEATGESPFATPQPPLTSLLLRAALASFLAMASYYLLRPVRDELSTEYRDDVATWWIWVAFLAVATMPLYSLLTSKASRSNLSKTVFRVVALALVGFAWFSYTQGSSPDGFGRSLAATFYVVGSLYPLFVISVLWGTLSKCFKESDGRKRFGWIFAAGTSGSLLGSFTVTILGDDIRPEWLLLGTSLLLVASSFAIPTPPQTEEASQRDSGGEAGRRLRTGLERLVRSPYLLAICAYLLLFTMGSGFLYFLQRDVIYDAYPDRGDRRAVLGALDLATQLLALFGQALITGVLLQRLGTARVLLIVPMVSVVGFAAFAFMPTFFVFAALSTLRRASNYAFAKPARELLFTVVDDEERFQTKPFIDVGVYRMGDLVASQTYEGIQKGLNASAATMAMIAVPLSILWMPVAVWLGRQQSKRARADSSD